MKILPNGIAVIAGDTHVSKWVKDSNTLEIAKSMISPFQKYISIGGVVLDVGACIGDHTITYAKLVGSGGLVFAFEPNKEAYECLVHNMLQFKQVVPIPEALSSHTHSAELVRSVNAGASHLEENEFNVSSVSANPLDDYKLQRIDFIKIDVEGYEVRVLQGGAETIKTCRPAMLIEVNHRALERAGTSSEILKELIISMDYSVQITDSRLRWSDLQFDIICLPIEKAH